jgi:hypothetical protein
LWLSGHSSTERQIVTSLKKMGCSNTNDIIMGKQSYDETSANSSSSSNVIIRNLAVEIANQILKSTSSNNDENNNDASSILSFDGERYLKSVYHDVKKWIRQGYTASKSSESNEDHHDEDNPQPPVLWVVLDDVSSLGTILGDRVVYCFVDSILSLVSTLDNDNCCGTIIRCSIDLDQMAHKLLATEDKDVSGWIGSGGLSIKQSQKDSLYRSSIPWERYLIHNSSVDGIIDVLPLPSGFSREAHGRLIFSETPNGRGWGRGAVNKPSLVNATTKSTTDTSITKRNKLITNYCIQDTEVKAWSAPGS